MKIIDTINEMREFVYEARCGGKCVGLVPTMGFFHEGHLSLMRRAKEDNDVCVVSLFVNPTQFGPREDFRRYPKDLDRDAELAEGVGVDVIFSPSVEEMYTDGYQTYVKVERVSAGMCGASRPDHFPGVASVVLKLFNIVQPDRAYFGEKDFQQLCVIRRMVRDLNVPVEVVGMPIVREADGLAMSSRNSYLGEEERKAALVLCRSLSYARERLQGGMTNVDSLKDALAGFVRREPLVDIDYIEVVDPETLECVGEICDNVLVALAVLIGGTRLIDNAVINLRGD